MISVTASVCLLRCVVKARWLLFICLCEGTLPITNLYTLRYYYLDYI